jgi:hypothetical protein
MARNESIFDLPEFAPYRKRWAGHWARAERRRRYYDGTIYSDSEFKLAHKLYAQTQSLFALLARAVDLDAALVPGPQGPWDLGDDVPDAIHEAQRLLYRWSSWGVTGDDWISDGAITGEAALKIVPDLEAGIVRLERLRPESLVMIDGHVRNGEPGPLGLIVDTQAEDATGERYEYGEAITPDEIRTYRNGQPWGYDGQPDRFPNPLGFVPIVQNEHDSDARPTFAKAQSQIRAVNELASYIADIIGRHAEPQWAVAGADEAELVRSGDNVWFLPAGAKVEAILAQIDIPGSLEFIREIKLEAKACLPELAFDDLRAKAQIATETLELQLVELDAKIWRMRRRYDAALVDAHSMAALAAAISGIGGIEALLQPHEFDYRRPTRPVSRLDQIRLEEAELALEMQRQMAGGEGLTASAMTELLRAGI